MKVGVQLVLFAVLDEAAAGAVDHALGRAGGAGGVKDVEGVIEGKPGKVDFGGLAVGEVVPGDPAGLGAGAGGWLVGDKDGGLDGGHGRK